VATAVPAKTRAAGGEPDPGGGAPTRPGRLAPHEWRRLRTGLLFISPWIVGVLAFVVYPIVYSFLVSLTRYSGMSAPEWLGLRNYTAAAVDPLVHTAVHNTVFYALLAVPLGLVVALGIAIAMNQNLREVAWYRTALFIPSLVPAFALGFVFVVFVNPQYGLVNQALGLFGGGSFNLLGDPTTAKLVIVAMAQLAAGNAALIFLAGLRNIPTTLYEAARIDGAGPVRQFLSITLPLVSPVVLFNLITGITGALQIFTEGYVVSSGDEEGIGAPDNGTLFYMLYLYRNAFTYASLGYASALAVVLFLTGIALSALVYRLSQRFVTYDVETG
jgi:multiple sugar transport system permease protein